FAHMDLHPIESIMAHRVSWIVHYGHIPSQMLVLHKCDNRICVRPDHLFLGTYADNMHECIKKGRKKGKRGEASNFAKLSDIQILEIRRLRKLGMSPTLIAKQFGVTYGHIWCVVTRKVWTHI